MHRFNVITTFGAISSLAPIAAADVFLSYDAFTMANNPFTCDQFENTGFQSVRVYLDGMDPDSSLDAIYATPADPMTITTTDPAGFYNSRLVLGSLPPTPIAFVCLVPDIQWDTWITIGQFNEETNTTAVTAGFPNIAEPDGGAVIVNLAAEESWFNNDLFQPVLEDNGRVVIGQFTVGETHSVSLEVNALVTPGASPGGPNSITGLTLYVHPANNLCPGDIDGDFAVGTSDLLQLLAAWGPCPTGCPEDIDGDLTVSTSDLLMLLANWGFCGP